MYVRSSAMGVRSFSVDRSGYGCVDMSGYGELVATNDLTGLAHTVAG